MACLVLSKIQTMTESSIEILVLKIQSLKIIDINGEDIDTTVSLVQATANVLSSAGKQGHN